MAGRPLSRTIAVKEDEALCGWINGMRAGALALIVLSCASATLAGRALWPADAAQSEARTWIRDGDRCRYVPLSEAVDARPCQL